MLTSPNANFLRLLYSAGSNLGSTLSVASHNSIGSFARMPSAVRDPDPLPVCGSGPALGTAVLTSAPQSQRAALSFVGGGGGMEMLAPLEAPWGLAVRRAERGSSRCRVVLEVSYISGTGLEVLLGSGLKPCAEALRYRPQLCTVWLTAR
ncbi:unnamed protein product [Lota lota]